MSDKLLFVPFAYDASKNTSANISKSTAFETYCKNLCVSLVSLKRENPNCDVALVTNCTIPFEYENILKNNTIHIYNEPFNEFIYPDNFTWSLAFYKLCALNAMTKHDNYTYYCYVDADVIANLPLDSVWEECNQHIMLYDINHGLNVSHYNRFIDEVFVFTGEKRYITHYGGEFFAGNKIDALEFVETCKTIYNKTIRENITFNTGDEFIVSIAADQLKHKVKNAGAYIFRFWTGVFRLVSTCYKFNSVLILHLPSEKQQGIARIFDKYIVKGKYPSKKQIYRICHLEHPSYSLFVKRKIRLLLKPLTRK